VVRILSLLVVTGAVVPVGGLPEFGQLPPQFGAFQRAEPPGPAAGAGARMVLLQGLPQVDGGPDRRRIVRRRGRLGTGPGQQRGDEVLHDEE
jgi:hypothetical protein